MRAILLFLLFGLFLFAVAFNTATAYQQNLDFALTWAVRVLGFVIAATAAFATLIRALARQTLEQQLGYVLPLFAGLLLTGPHWGVALGLAFIVVALAGNAILGRSIPPREGPGTE